MAYTNAIFYLDREGGSDAARTALTSVTASNPSGSITRLTKTGHGLVTGAVVDLTLFSAWLNGAWKVTVVDADNVDLDGAVWQATADASGTLTPRGGSSKADAWQTVTSGATAARIAAGDTLRLMASPDETLVGDAAWTDLSKTVTLASAVTANISDCESAWTASANVTATADTVTFKEGTKSAKLVIAAGFTTGLLAYVATGTLDLSAYQQVSFWFRSTAATAASTLSLRLCSDAAGVTTVHTVPIPAIPTAGWVPLTVDVGSALSSAIGSMALYADLDPGAVTVQLDNILACKAAASADALTLTSLLGKVHNRCWAASTTYAANAIRKPSQPHRNGYRYQVTAGGGGNSGASEPTWPQLLGATVTDGALTWTCAGLEDTWYAIQSINGTTAKLDNSCDTLGNAGRGYAGESETIATYRREPLALPMVTSSTVHNTLNKAGTALAPITLSGGWNRTDMTTQTGETWFSGQSGNGYGVYAPYAESSIENVNCTRCNYGALITSGPAVLRNSHVNNCTYGANSSASILLVRGLVANNSSNSTAGMSFAGNGVEATCLRVENTLSGSGVSFNMAGGATGRMHVVSAKNNAAYGAAVTAASAVTLTDLVTSDNASGGVSDPKGALTLINASMAETTTIVGGTAFTGAYTRSQQHNQTADNHLIVTDGGTIASATDQRHTASGISWKFQPTSTNRAADYPLVLSVAKLACAANVAVSVQVWTYRDSTTINGQLRVRAGQLAGVPETTVDCAPAINTWVQSDSLAFTPTEAGVVEIEYLAWDGVGTTASLWIDDVTVS